MLFIFAVWSSYGVKRSRCQRGFTHNREFVVRIREEAIKSYNDRHAEVAGDANVVLQNRRSSVKRQCIYILQGKGRKCIADLHPVDDNAQLDVQTATGRPLKTKTDKREDERIAEHTSSAEEGNGNQARHLYLQVADSCLYELDVLFGVFLRERLSCCHSRPVAMHFQRTNSGDLQTKRETAVSRSCAACLFRC